MFGPYRRFPFRGLALVAIGFLLASALAGGTAASSAAAGFGLLFALPLLMFKMFLMFMFFGALFRFAGGGWGRGRAWGHQHGPRHPHGPWHPHDGGERPERRDPVADAERRDWEESLRQAREEVRKFDTSDFPPRGPFTPPTDEPEAQPKDAAPPRDA